MNKKKKNTLRRESILKHTKTILGSLFSNQTAIDGARHYPWWVALIFFVLSICLPVIPVITSNYFVSGSQFMSGQTKGFNTYITAFVIDLKLNNVDLKVNENHILTQENWGDVYSYSQDRQYVYTNTNSKQIDFLVYFTNTTGNDFAQFNQEISKRQYQVGTDQLYVAGSQTTSSSTSEGSEESIQVYTPTYMLFGPESYVVQIYQPNSVEVFSNTSGDYVHVERNTSIASFGNEAIIKPGSEGNKYEQLANPEYVEEVNNNFKNFFDLGYLTNRNNSTLYSTLLTLGIYLVLAFFMGLMIFLLTRGKKNIMHILSFYTCQKINAWVMLSPAILGMIIGFLMSQFAMVGFILLVGLRVMWMSFRQLRPVVK